MSHTVIRDTHLQAWPYSRLLYFMHIKSHPKPWAVSGVWASPGVYKVRVPPWAPEGSAVFAVFLALRRPRAFWGSGRRFWFSGAKKRNFKLFLIVRGCFWVRVPPLAGSRFWQFFGFVFIFAFLRLQNGQLELPKGPRPRFEEFISRIPSIILLHFGFPQRTHVPFQASGSWKTRFSSWKCFWTLPKVPKWPFGRRSRHELPCASWRLQLGGKHVSPRENAFGGFQSCQNGRSGGVAVTAQVRTLNPLSLELPCASWRLNSVKNTCLLVKMLLEASNAAKMAVWEAQRSRQRFEP